MDASWGVHRDVIFAGPTRTTRTTRHPHDLALTVSRSGPTLDRTTSIG